jgi:ElaB/YqjD/DUF883 family membrane-anchored ribosome-binding protein
MTQQKSGYPIGQGGTESAKDRLRDMADATGERMKDAATSAQDMANRVADQAREYGDQAQEAAKQVRPYLEKSLKEKPMATLAVAAGVAFVLGALWKK